jgi:hypothetical protein
MCCVDGSRIARADSMFLRFVRVRSDPPASPTRAPRRLSPHPPLRFSRQRRARRPSPMRLRFWAPPRQISWRPTPRPKRIPRHVPVAAGARSSWSGASVGMHHTTHRHRRFGSTPHERRRAKHCHEPLSESPIKTGVADACVNSRLIDCRRRSLPPRAIITPDLIRKFPHQPTIHCPHPPGKPPSPRASAP